MEIDVKKEQERVQGEIQQLTAQITKAIASEIVETMWGGAHLTYICITRVG